MTTNELRQKIYITAFGRSPLIPESDACISYKFDGKSKVLELSTQLLAIELMAIASIDSEDEVKSYSLSQWDSLEIVIRHEYKKAVDKEIEHLFKL